MATFFFPLFFVNVYFHHPRIFSMTRPSSHSSLNRTQLQEEGIALRGVSYQRDSHDSSLDYPTEGPSSLESGLLSSSSFSQSSPTGSQDSIRMGPSFFEKSPFSHGKKVRRSPTESKLVLQKRKLPPFDWFLFKKRLLVSERLAEYFADLSKDSC